MKFILGYEEGADITDDGRNLTLYDSKRTASFESEEWCEVEADSEEEARRKYLSAFEEWEQNPDIETK